MLDSPSYVVSMRFMVVLTTAAAAARLCLCAAVCGRRALDSGCGGSAQHAPKAACHARQVHCQGARTDACLDT